MTDSETVDIAILGVVKETQKGVQVELDNGEKIWLPSAQVEIDGETMAVAKWLAIREGLIDDDDSKDSL